MNDLRDYIAGVDTMTPTTKGLRPYINLDNAATTPAFKSVLAAVNEFTPFYSSIHRGNGFKSRLSTDIYERSREIVRDFVGANANDHIVIFGKNTTNAINTLSHRLHLRRKDIVLLSHLEHHSNDLPWRAKATTRRIAVSPDGRIDQEDFLRLLQRYKSRVKLVALSGASNVSGGIPDIHWFARQAHTAGAQIFVDCAQLAAHRQITIKPLSDPEHLDYIAFSAHKMYAPFGCGALVARRDTFMIGNPEHVGGGTITAVTEKTVDWAAPPDSDEAGSPNVIGAMTLAKSIETIQEIGIDRIAAHEEKLTAYMLRTLKNVPGITLYGDRNLTKGTRSGVVPFTLQGVPSHLVAARLGYEWGIAVRSGCFCAQPYVMSLLHLNPNEVRQTILDNKRGNVPGLVRVSVGLYNTTDEIDQLVEALTVIAAKPSDDYLFDERTGSYTPKQNDTPDAISTYFPL